MRIYNTYPRYGDQGPFEAASFGELADEMMPIFNDWLDEQEMNWASGESRADRLAEMRRLFVDSLMEVQ